ncbi:IclR family transcriptional regulator [Alkalicoccobacillus plakortidis]|uniref:IclR family transcriptional regulator n=1 Tax=Alkalicoccobacillus plakortidis TaxID=444060 RepID=A0ABT0XJ13_9BACI|nr:IclR family transcriptional regulator [Alkalicoccobacillus plakortidis]MCM2675889.1 IclR family transcriptional regulator [Alkalicoccobacillus plakortidis]
MTPFSYSIIVGLKLKETPFRNKERSQVGDNQLVQAVDRALEIIDILKEHPKGLGVTEIANRIGVVKSTAHRLLSSLESKHYVRRTVDQQRYRLGLKFLEIKSYVIDTTDIVEEAHPLLEELVEKVGEITHLVLLDGFEMVYIDKVEPNQTIRIFSRTGKRAPIHCTGVGKAIAAHFNEAQLKKYFHQAELEGYTPHTFTSEEAFREELSQIKQLGYALDNEEHELGIRCVAAPIWNHEGKVENAISVTGPIDRMSDEKIEELKPILIHTANLISKAIGAFR